MGLLKELKVKLGLDSSGFNRGIEETKEKTNVFNGVLKKTGIIAAAAFAVKKIADFGLELVKLGGQARGVQDAFAKIGNKTTLDGLRQATRGTVSDIELMKQAVKARNFDIPLQNLAGLFEFARRRAKATGESVDYLTESIVTGIGRKSPLILDNLGISASQLSKELNGVAVASSSIGDITAAVERIAKKAMGNMAEDTMTASERADALAASWQNVKVKFSQMLADSSKLNSFLEGLALRFEQIGQTDAEKSASSLFRTIKEEAKTPEQEMELLQTAFQNTKNNIDELKKSIDKGRFWFEGRSLKKQLEAEEGLFEQISFEIRAREEAKRAEEEQLKLAKEREAAEKRIAYLSLRKANADLTMGGIGGTSFTAGVVTGGIGLPTTIDTSRFSAPLDEAEARMKAFNDRMNELAQDFVNSAVAGFSDGMQTIADSLVMGDFNAGAFVAALLTPLADMAIRTGEVAIGIGIGIESIKKALTSLSGIGAIAAGVALIAIGATAKSLLKSAASGGGGGTSSRNAGSGLQAIPVTGGSSIIAGGEAAAGISGNSMASQLGNVEFRIKGDDLVGVFDRQNKRGKNY